MISNRVRFLIISILIFIGAYFSWRLFFDDSIRLSKPQGFYDEEFDLKIKSKLGVDIYYTLDGTEPTKESIQYSGPIHIKNVSDNDNIYSMIEEISVYYKEDATGKENPYKAPNYKIDKCIPLRVATFNKKGEKKSEDAYTYWVGYKDKDGYENVYSVSVITDPSNFFDYEKGIYVNGRIFDEYLKREKYSSVLHGWEANYNERGLDWERPAYFSVFDEERKLLYDSNAGVRIQGKGSRKNAQKSLGLYAREEYSGSNNFETSFFGRSKGTEKIKLSGSGQDEFLKLKDWLVSSLIAESDLKIATQQMIPANVFIDGEYWGVYYITECFNADYVESHYGVDKDNVIIVSAMELVEGEEGDKETYYDITYNFARQYGAEGDLLDHITTYYIDLDSYVDFYAVELFIGNMDWPLKNAACWRARETGNGEYNDGRFRWMIFDVNYAYTLENVESDILSKAIKEDALFNALMQNPIFQKKIYNRVEYISEQVFSSNNIDKYIGAWKEEMEVPVKKSNFRFTGEEKGDFINEKLDTIQYFCEHRGDYLLNQLQQAFDGTLEVYDEDSEHEPNYYFLDP